MKKTANYDEVAHPAVRNFWQNPPADHPFSQHPLLRQYGDTLSRAAYAYIAERAERAGEDLSQMEMMQAGMRVQQVFMQIMQMERAHAPQLIELAKDITVQIWGVPRQMLEGEITDNVDMGDEDGGEMDEPEEPPQLLEITPELRDQINKRLTLNTMTQGSAVHAYQSMHHLVDQRINAISPQLLQLYNSLTSVSTGIYWMVDVQQMMAGGGAQAAGNERVVPVNEPPIEVGDAQEAPERVDAPGEEQPEGDQGAGGGQENQQYKIEAKAVCFPILCQEFSKGVMEYLSLRHGGLQQLQDAELRTIYRHADRRKDEPWLIQVGPELWRRFLAVLPQGMPLAKIVAALAKKSPATVHAILNAVITNPQNAQRFIAPLVAEANPPEEDDQYAPEPE
jgi:hypothetical protein